MITDEMHLNHCVIFFKKAAIKETCPYKEVQQQVTQAKLSVRKFPK
jgi:hypothetical protein